LFGLSLVSRAPLDRKVEGEIWFRRRPARGPPGPISRELHERGNLPVDRIAKQDFGELILAAATHPQLLAYFLGEPQEIVPRNTVLVFLDLLFDPFVVHLP